MKDNDIWHLNDITIKMSKRVGNKKSLPSIYDFDIKNSTTDVSGKVSLVMENFSSDMQFLEENDILMKAIEKSDQTLYDFWNKYIKQSDDAEIRKMTHMLLLIAFCINQKSNINLTNAESECLLPND